MSSKSWLADVRAGDTVYREVGFTTSYHRETVIKVTATQIVCERTRYRRDSGRLVGATGYRIPYLVEPTKQVIDRCRADEVLSNLNNLLRSKDNVEVLLYLGDALDRYQKYQTPSAEE